MSVKRSAVSDGVHEGAGQQSIARMTVTYYRDHHGQIGGYSALKMSGSE